MAQKRLKYIWNEVKDIAFEFIEVKGDFNDKSSFSSVDLNWDKYPNPANEHSITILFKELVDFNPDSVLPENTENTMKYITNGCKLVQWPPLTVKSELDYMLFLHKDIFSPLCREDEVVFEKKKKFIAAGIKTDYIGMGTLKTWHGSPNARVRECDLVLPKVLPTTGTSDDDHDGDSDNDGSCSSSDAETEMSPAETEVSSDGATTAIEAKKKNVLFKHFSQLASTCVVSSFTEHKIHPTKNTLIPTVLIDRTTLRVCMYDCKSDILLLSQPRLLSHNNTRLSTTALLFLWIVLNHRLYLLPVPHHAKQYKSKILSHLEEHQALEDYEKLDDKGCVWPKKRKRLTERPLQSISRKKRRLG